MAAGAQPQEQSTLCGLSAAPVSRALLRAKQGRQQWCGGRSRRVSMGRADQCDLHRRKLLISEGFFETAEGICAPI